ncbi:proteasome assembly chaperone family protein [Candidatus Woesearchaeota archaeon]|nr:proteasome assembly chaperone family protein [Candidatus Woesearchaeota archaeon]
MKPILHKKPQKPIIIQGFPGFGLVSTISIKFLLEHLEVEEIGSIESEHLAPLTAIHKGKVLSPITLFYNQKYNLVIIQALTEVTGYEWELAETLTNIARSLDAKEIITLESTPSHEGTMEVYYFSNKNKIKNLKPVEESIIMGTTAAFLLKCKDLPSTCIFAEAHSQLPDSESAAKVVESLSSYLGFKIDTKPLLEQARKFEVSLRHYMQKAKKGAVPKMSIEEKKEQTNYFG